MDSFQLKRRDFLWGLVGLSGSVITRQSPFNPIFARRLRCNGAGASFPALIFQRWFMEYQKINHRIHTNYYSIGNDLGIQEFMSNKVEFSAIDGIVDDAMMALISKEAIVVPVTAGSVVVAYTNRDVDNLKLTAQQLGDIFLGKIRDWKELGAAESKPIKVVYHSDDSGTTQVFSQYLTQANFPQRRKIDISKFRGIGAKGNEGVSATVSQTDGAIGYVGLGFAQKHYLKTAQLQNKKGDFVMGNVQNISFSSPELSTNLKTFDTDYNGLVRSHVEDDSYPIINFSWIITHKKDFNATMDSSIKNFLNWVLCKDGGQKYATELGYLPLPNDIGSPSYPLPWGEGFAE